jgi:hypothetical protein
MKLTEFQTPTGAKGNLLSPASWLQLIIGSAVMIATFAMGQSFLKRVGTKLPIDTQIDPIISVPNVAKSAPQKMVF